jgi:hypothetical protein
MDVKDCRRGEERTNSDERSHAERYDGFIYPRGRQSTS